MSLARPEFVVDASIGVKWYLPEVYSEEARRLLLIPIRLHVPTIFFTEVTQAIWKKVRLRRELDPTEGREILSRLMDADVRTHAVNPLLNSALDVALDTGRTVYDCVYLVLAQAQGCPLVTADLKFYNSLRSTPLASSLVWVGDLGGDAPEPS